jgi:hypothetical protein
MTARGVEMRWARLPDRKRTTTPTLVGARRPVRGRSREEQPGSRAEDCSTFPPAAPCSGASRPFCLPFCPCRHCSGDYMAKTASCHSLERSRGRLDPNARRRVPDPMLGLVAFPGPPAQVPPWTLTRPLRKAGPFAAPKLPHHRGLSTVVGRNVLCCSLQAVPARLGSPSPRKAAGRPAVESGPCRFSARRPLNSTHRPSSSCGKIDCIANDTKAGSGCRRSSRMI